LASGFIRRLLSLIVVVAGVTAAQTAPPEGSVQGVPPGPIATPIKPTPAQSAPPRKDIPAIAKSANGAIVTVITATGDRPIAQGTGFLVSADGMIVTNYHVIKEGNVAIVKFPDGTVLPVDGVLAADKVRDLAVIKIHGKPFRTLTLGNSDQIQVGEEVIAIGNPLGLELTVSNGILSGVRSVKKEGGKFLQVTAPISHGSSGGPLFNMAGEVVGITAMYFEGGENLNFAIPVNDAKLLLQKRSAKLQDLPNEADTEESPKETNAEATPAQEQTCNKQAEKFAGYKRRDYGHVKYPFKSGYTNHYDAETSRCYVEVVLDFGAGKNPTQSIGWFSGRLYFIYDASVEGEGSPEYGSFNQSEDRESCSIQPSGRPNIRCRSEEEFNELGLKYFGIIQSTTTLLVIPPNQPNGPWPPSAKIAAGSWTSKLAMEDGRYCYQNPAESLYFLPSSLDIFDGHILSCSTINNSMEAQEKSCRAAKNSTKDCDEFLRKIEVIKAGL
jgi:S1-C subfamily serine protease